jgi:tetratricopeptide (TPR) repeat protein
VRRRLLLAAAALCLLAAAVAPNPELAKLESERDARPNDPERRVALGGAYYRHARFALDQQDFTAYQAYLGKAMDEVLEGARLDPASPGPHFVMGVVAAYQGDIERAFRSFANMRRLAPRSWVTYTNLAEVMVYKGSERRDVERWLDRAEKLGANAAVVDLNLCLLTWRDGDLAAAERHFRRVVRLDPSVLESWNEAPVPKPIRTLPDLMAYCCGSPACGPYLAEACATSQLEVAKRELPAEVKRQELVIEMERRRKLERIYEKHKELEVQVEAPEPVPEPTAP